MADVEAKAPQSAISLKLDRTETGRVQSVSESRLKEGGARAADEFIIVAYQSFH